MVNSMNPIDQYLLRARQSVWRIAEYDWVTVVMGNEACDLDSAVSSVILGYYYHDTYKRSGDNALAMTILDVPQAEIDTKTEVMYWFSKQKVSMTLMLFRGDIDFDILFGLGKLKLILVDHHTLPQRYVKYASAVTQIMDHRPIDRTWKWPGVKVQISYVGSCSTLVAKELLDQRRDLFSLQLTMLLYGPIVLDTGGLCPHSDRTSSLDIEIAEVMETLYPVCKREEVFKELCAARADITKLTTSLVVRKDVKLAYSIPVCSIPLLIEGFIRRRDVGQELLSFTNERKSPILVLMGMDIHNEIVTRDIGIFSVPSKEELAEKLAKYLQEVKTPNLQLKRKAIVVDDSIKEDKADENAIFSVNLLITNFIFFTQGNVQISRKQLLPLIQSGVFHVPELRPLKELQCFCEKMV